MNNEKYEIERSSVEYQPDAIELANQPLPWWGRKGLVICGVFFLLVLIWASVSKVDVIVDGIGRVTADKPIIVMKPLERTVIESVEVKVGQQVEPGQVLITFDPTSARADAARLAKDKVTYQAQFDRLKAEFDETDYNPENKSDPDVARQYELFKQRQAFFKEKLNYYDGAINRMSATIHSTKSSLENIEEQLVVLNQIVDIYENLKENSPGAISVKELLQVRINQLQMTADVNSTRNYINELEHEKESTAAAKNSFIQEWKQNISELFIRAGKDLYDTSKTLEKAEMIASFVDLRSPTSAIVHEIAPFAKGSAVREAENLITLIPINEEMLVDAEIPPRNIGKIKVGDPVRIKLTAYPYQKHGTLNGEIVSISESTFNNQDTGFNEDIGKKNVQTYYRVRIKITGKLRNVGDNFRLIPGMEAQAEILTGSRRVIEFLIYPLIKSLDEAGREP